MSLSVLFASIISGGIFLYLEKYSSFLQITAVVAITGVIIFSQKQYFSPPSYAYSSNYSDKDFIYPTESFLPKDYLPLSASTDSSMFLNKFRSSVPLNNITAKSNLYEFSHAIEKSSKIILPIYYFPGWKAEIDEQEVPIDQESGFVKINASEGRHSGRIVFAGTVLENVATWISLSVAILVGLCFLKLGLLAHFKNRV